MRGDIKHKIPGILIMALLFAMYAGCGREDDYPMEPVLNYSGFMFRTNPEGMVTEGVLVLEFTDGDGDIGLGQDDTLPPFHFGGGNYYNFYINLFTKQQGVYVPVTFPDTTYNFHSRIPRVEFTGNSKAIKGEIEYTFDLLIMKPFLPSDTLMIETWIFDRALNQSNMVRTPDIIIP
jgi:hypothetical protein